MWCVLSALALLQGGRARQSFEVDDVWSVEPGRYGRNPPSIDSPEFLLIARRPPA